MSVEPNQTRQRLASAAAVAVFHALLGYALLTGLAIEIAGKAGERLKLLDIRQAPPPPLPEPPQPALKDDAPQAAAAPAGLEAEASPIVAPPPEVRLEVRPPLPAAPEAGAGSASFQGAATQGAGTGAGGEGWGTGSGGSGAGTGGGGAVTGARQVAGELSGRDYPRAAKRARAGGTVLVRYTIGIDGRPSGCTITQSSGNDELDRTTCRLIEKRFRYEPARDARGDPVPDTVTGRHIWWTEPRACPERLPCRQSKGRPRYPYEPEAPVD